MDYYTIITNIFYSQGIALDYPFDYYKSDSDILKKLEDYIKKIFLVATEYNRKKVSNIVFNNPKLNIIVCVFKMENSWIVQLMHRNSTSDSIICCEQMVYTDIKKCTEMLVGLLTEEN